MTNGPLVFTFSGNFFFTLVTFFTFIIVFTFKAVTRVLGWSSYFLEFLSYHMSLLQFFLYKNIYQNQQFKMKHNQGTINDHMSLVTRKPVFGVCNEGRLKVACSATEAR